VKAIGPVPLKGRPYRGAARLQCVVWSYASTELRKERDLSETGGLCGSQAQNEYLVLRVGMLGPRMSTIDPVFLPHLSA
jgi:hypothetical protein